MFKLTIKIGIFALVVLGAGIILPGHKAEANTGQCPSNPTAFSQAQNSFNWGVSPQYNGAHGGNMAGLIVSAYDASTNQSIDTVYHINSGISGTDPDWGVVNGQQTNLNDRIFMDIDGNFSNRTNSFQSYTDNSLGLEGAHPTQCTGWDAFGPGGLDTSQIGNGYVLDCGPSNSPTHFWFSNLRPTPIGSTQNGYWSISVNGPSGSYTIPHYTEGSSSYGQNYFTVTNGQNTFVQMIWHPNTWTTHANSSVNPSTAQPGQTVTFTHTITTSGDQPSYTWNVVRKYPNDSSPVIARSSPPGYVTTNTNVSISYQIPGGAQDGQQYCQRITFSNQQGGSPASGSSSNACVTVSMNGGGCTDSNGCDASHSLGCSETTYDVSHQDGHRQYIQLTGTDHDGSYLVADNGQGRDTIDLKYAAVSQTVHVIIHRYTWNGSDWIEDSDSPVDHSYGCYHASCSIAQVIDDEQGPPGTVVAGHQFTLQVQVKNDNTDPSAETIPSTVGGYNFSVTEPPENGNPNYTHNDTGFSLNPPGQPYDEGTVFINFTAPSTAQLYHITLYPDLEPHASLGDDCSVDVPIFQHFNIDPSVSIVPGTNAEDPYIAGSTQHGVSYTVGGSLTEGTTTTATTKGSLTNASGTTVDGEHDTIDTYGTGISRQYNYPISSMNAGDQYCPKVTISPGNGYHGPSGYGDRGDNDATKNGNCLTITNEPYFKAKGAGGLAADVKQVAKPSSSGTFTCSGSSDGGLLAGWNDNADPAGADRGASSELSALALLQITGVASDQPASTVTNSPNKLSFANVGKYTASDGSLKPMPAVSSSLDSPALGGYYGGSGDACVTPTKPADVQAKSSPGATTAVTISSLGGSTPHYEYGSSGSTTKVDFGTDTITKPDTKVFVNGDVYISGKIVYSTSGWSYDPGTKTDSIPSLTLYASGNIYIAAGVTQLDGTYISGGTIYTCGTSAYKACAASSLFNGAKNQLVVNGSFVADQVKLLRTFGSLRDEVPTVVPGSTGLPTNVEWSSCGAYGKPQNGESCLSASPSSLGLTCTAINEPGDPNGWGDNVLCLPNSSSLKLAWTSYAANSCTLVQQLIGSAGCNISSGQANLDYIKSHGYPYCTPWNAPDSKNYGWNDNWLCMNQPRATGDPVLEFSLTNDTSQNCTPISEVADSDGTSDGKQTWAKGYYLCEPKATGPSIVPPTLTKCSNAGTWIDHKTCAAEVFQLSPELYLTEPENNGGNGAGSDDSITSLPPVL